MQSFQSNSTIQIQLFGDVIFNSSSILVSSGLTSNRSISLFGSVASFSCQISLLGSPLYVDDTSSLSNFGLINLNTSIGGKGLILNYGTILFNLGSQYTPVFVNSGSLLFSNGFHTFLSSFSTSSSSLTISFDSTVNFTNPVTIIGVLGGGTLHAMNLTIPTGNWTWQSTIIVDQMIFIQNDTIFDCRTDRSRL
jgi:hypothetical protein